MIRALTRRRSKGAIRRWNVRISAAIGLLTLANSVGVAVDEGAGPPAGRQALADARWTGPILAASASTLPKDHVLIEP